MSRHVMIAIPAHDHSVKFGTFLSVLRARDQINAMGGTVAVQTWMGDSLLPSARNILLAKFNAAKEFTDFVFVDHDVWWEGDELLRLLSHPVDFVAGSYRHKSDDESYPMGWLDDPEGKGLWAVDPATNQPSETGLIEVGAAPTGFCRLTRAAVDKLYAAYPERMYASKMAPDLQVCGLFEVPFVEGVGVVGEDYIFAQYWRKIGGKVWLDPALNLNHSGHKEYVGSLGSWLRNRNAPKGEDAERELARLREMFSTAEFAKLFDVALGDAA
jgi:hypothetical protein